jgi:hypothetical protein
LVVRHDRTTELPPQKPSPETIPPETTRGEAHRAMGLTTSSPVMAGIGMINGIPGWS